MGRAYQNRKESIAKTAAAKSKVYSKYGRRIYVVAKQGGPDPDANLALRSLIDSAKRDQVPAHVIEKAIEKAKGVGGEDYSPAMYEGFGPGNCMVMVECLTDNPNRTITEVRNCFTKTKCKIGAPGSVAHMFDHLAILVFAGEDDESVLETLLMADVEVADIEVNDGKITVFAPHTESHKAKQALLEAQPELEFEVDEIQYVPQIQTTLSGDDVEIMEKFLDMLNDCDDVQHIYHNAEF
ncbi:YebC/PmpR family DNA-binding transcriptional regulator [Pseudidiomarina taiwanensis]|uniref:Probable transcriptional regulatory protein CWI83_08380 n=1 Tax=Pseudidiomarina taiwanensis TaxID=337250 RepID=A0A432ZEQ1_9GAMM|nr:YebC/PmpR family DNA-binding transcriptional regulator [Pseudidiomarina taiwanensis]RUO76370.1 YebC/PmpR family DNA-binding transcriptional regulator [Pseudidiomarina taiwanensis]